VDDPGRWTDLDRPPLLTGPLRAAVTGGPDPAWRALHVVDSTTSTNTDLAARARDGEPEGYVLVADHQSAGRGRLGRQWQAPPRSGLAVSVLLRPVPDPERWSWLPLLAGQAVVDVLHRICGLPARLKWPNDVLVPDGGRGGGVERKVCGVLADLVADSTGRPVAVVLGAGINVSQSAGELPVPTATSLRLAGAASTDRGVLARAYLRALAARYRSWARAGGDARACGLAAAYRESCATIGARVRVALPGGGLDGVADGVDDRGRLLLCDDGGTVHSLAAGDVVHVRPGADPPVGPGGSDRRT
jgi:BirA family transcriptional regulator, biotin operon repressor / biotin---[acetyl-CoA-carboxylase] ligase